MSLLPANALTNVRVGISVSPSSDLARLGLMEHHFRLALGELARTVLVLGGKLQYCGHLEPTGYTVFLISELKRYGRLDDPLSVILAWSVHRRLSVNDFWHVQHELGLLGSLTCLDLNGAVADFSADRGDEPPELPEDQIAPSLTAMRQTAIRDTQGRVFIGGRRSGYQGVMPGILEEALLALTAGQPVFLAGGFGGVTHDIVRRVDPAAAAWFPPEEGNTFDEGWRIGLDSLEEMIVDQGWTALANGLDAAENMKLAATHRPSEIAALVSLGLGRLAQRGAYPTRRSTPD